jgi:hypothetical protein
VAGMLFPARHLQQRRHGHALQQWQIHKGDL